MRLALISDIHGNFSALQAVLTDAQRQRAEAIVCLGDVATSGPQPRQVVAELQKVGCPCILGNHESALLNPAVALRYQIAPTLIPSLHWTLAQLTSSDLDYMRAFKPTLELPLGADAGLLCFHGSPLSNTDLLLAATPAEDLAEMIADSRAQVFAGGHTHIQMLRQHDGKLIVNPGSVGQPFRAFPMHGAAPALLPWAEYAIVQSQGEALSVDLRRIPFDLEAYLRALADSALPIKDWLLHEYVSARQTQAPNG